MEKGEQNCHDSQMMTVEHTENLHKAAEYSRVPGYESTVQKSSTLKLNSGQGLEGLCVWDGVLAYGCSFITNELIPRTYN